MKLGEIVFVLVIIAGLLFSIFKIINTKHYTVFGRCYLSKSKDPTINGQKIDNIEDYCKRRAGVK